MEPTKPENPPVADVTVPNKRNSAPLIIVSALLVLLLGIGGFLGYMYVKNAAEISQKKEAIAKLEADYKAASDSLDVLSRQVQELYAAQLISDSAQQAQLAEIQQLRDELEQARKNGSSYSGSGSSAKLAALKQEMDAQYALLKAERDRLKTMNDSLQQLYAAANTERTTLKQENKQIRETLDEAKALRIFETDLIGVRMKKNGDRLLDDRVKKITHLDARFVITDNPVAEEGEYTAYIVITGPGKKVIGTNSTKTFEYMGLDKNYSLSRKFEFTGKKLDIIVSLEVGAKTLEAGKYTIEVYVEDALAGKKNVEFF